MRQPRRDHPFGSHNIMLMPHLVLAKRAVKLQAGVINRSRHAVLHLPRARLRRRPHHPSPHRICG